MLEPICRMHEPNLIVRGVSHDFLYWGASLPCQANNTLHQGACQGMEIIERSSVFEILERKDMNTFTLKKKWLAAPLLALAASLAGCGGGGDGGSPGGVQQDYGGNGQTSGYAVTYLTSDGSIPAANTDPNLKNGWGIAFNPNGFAWVAAAETSKALIYDSNGVLQQPVVSLPDGQAGPASPTGIVYNDGSTFTIVQGPISAPSTFIFAGEAGTISGWSRTVNENSAVTVYDGGAAGKIYKGLALAKFQNTAYLYAADFHNGAIDVFDGNFAPATLTGSFADPAIPAGYAPFGIQAIGDRIYVAYAQQDAEARDDVKGEGFGFVNVFDTGGNLVKRLVSNGPLNAPWGMALAPADFGSFANALLVGNFGNGWINAFDPETGAFLGTLSDANGAPIVIDGLWGIAFGNGQQGFPANSLFFAAGPNNEQGGSFGRIDPPK